MCTVTLSNDATNNKTPKLTFSIVYTLFMAPTATKLASQLVCLPANSNVKQTDVYVSITVTLTYTLFATTEMIDYY